MSTAPSESTSDTIAPAVHLEFIQNQLENKDASGAQEIEQYHRSLFLHHHAVEMERYRQESKTHENKLAFLEAQLKSAELGLAKRAKLVAAPSETQEEEARPTPPWNGWDIGMFTACLAGILGLIAFGVLNISFNLLESGFITFQENPLRAYFWAALLPVGALAVKVGWDCLGGQSARGKYLWGCLALGVVGVLVWVGAYACVYPTLSKGIDDQIAALSVFGSAGAGSATGAGLNFAGAKWVDVITVAGQAIAEIFLSAALGIYLTQLYWRHRPVRMAVDPAFLQLEQEKNDLDERVARERLELGEASGHLLRLENELSALIAYSQSLFHREAAKRADQAQRKQVILDQLSDHLRQHLDTAEPAGRFVTSRQAPSTLNPNNGD